jgi:hypothetical protein
VGEGADRGAVSLYDAVATAYDHHDADPLTVVKIESGSGFTVSLKGAADIVREVKNLIVEIWSKHRHRRADEIISHNRAVALSIEVLEHIETRMKKKSLQPEDGERLKGAVVTNTLSLFKNGALVTEIPHIESVDNRQLLVEFNSPKLLSAPASGSNSEELEHNGPTPKVTKRKPGRRFRQDEAE